MITKKLCEICQITVPKNKKALKDANGIYPLYSSNKKEEKTNIYEYDGNYIIVVAKGVLTGEVKYVNGKFNADLTVFVIKNKEELIDIKYLCYFLQFYFKKEKENIESKKQPFIKKQDLANIIVPILSKNKQKYIIELFDAFEKKKALNKEEYKLIKDKYKYYLDELINDHYSKKALENIAIEIKRGNDFDSNFYSELGINCIKYGDIHTSYSPIVYNVKNKVNDSLISKKLYCNNGDILIVVTSENLDGLGKTVAYLNNEKCLIGGDIIAIKHNLNAKYLSFAINSTYVHNQIIEDNFDTTIKHLSIKKIKKLLIPIASENEQEEIANTLESFINLLNFLKEKSDKLNLKYNRYLFNIFINIIKRE